MIRKTILVLSLTVFGNVSTHAHHVATATFDIHQDIEIEGYVKAFKFRNPHVSIILAVTDDNGVEKDWLATAPAVGAFRRWGWTRNMLEEGQYVRLVGRKARHDGPMILLERKDIDGGKLLEINPDDGSLVRVLAGPKPDQTPDVGIPDLRLSNGQPNISGTWLAISPIGRSLNKADFTAAGQALQDAWDPASDPAYLTCEPLGLARKVTSVSSLRITQREDYIILELEDDAARLIYLDGRAPASTEHTLRGHSTAHYEGDTLVVETTQLLRGESARHGDILSDQTTITERYSRADDEQYAALATEITFTDPVNLATPLVNGSRKLRTADYEFTEAKCELPVLNQSTLSN